MEEEEKKETKKEMAIPSRYERCRKPQTYKEATVKFITLSTIRGMKRVTMSVNWFWSGLWVASIVILLAVIIGQLAQHFRSYFEYNVVQTSLQQTDLLINYPSITICPLQPFNSEFAQPNVSDQYLNGDLHILQYLQQLEEKRDAGDISEDMLTLDAEGLASIIGYYQNIKPENVKKFGHALHDLILECKIEQTNATTGMKKYSDCGSITRIQSAQHFNCYTVVIPSSLEASVSNLAMILYLDDFGTLHYPTMLSRDYASQRHGVKVVIHEDDTWPNLDDGDEVPPGTAATFIITEKELTLAEPPWGNCSRYLVRENNLPIAQKLLVDQAGYKYKYTEDLCKKFESQRNVVHSCGCKLALLPIPDLYKNQLNDAENITFCDDIRLNKRDLAKDMICAQEQLKDFRDNDFDDELDKICPLPCYDQTYEYSKALSQWPHDAYHLAFYDVHIKNKSFANKFDVYENIRRISVTDHKKAYQQLLESNLIERNFVRLSFTMKYQFKVIKQEPKMSESQLLANVGGTLSLWLGISVIAIIEIVELLVDVFRIFRRRHSGNNVLQVTHVESNNVSNVQAVSFNSIDGKLGNSNGSTISNGFQRDRYSAFNEDCWF